MDKIRQALIQGKSTLLNNLRPQKWATIHEITKIALYARATGCHPHDNNNNRTWISPVKTIKMTNQGNYYKKYLCTEQGCNEIFTTSSHRARHVQSVHDQIRYHCDRCEKGKLQPTDLYQFKSI